MKYQAIFSVATLSFATMSSAIKGSLLRQQLACLWANPQKLNTTPSTAARTLAFYQPLARMVPTD